MDELNNTNPNNKTSSIHTYAGDMATMVRDNEASVIKIAMAEQRRRSGELEKEINSKQKNYAVLFGVLSLFLIVGAIFVYKYLEQKGKIEATHPEIVTQLPTLVPADTQTILKSDTIAGREDLVRILSNKKLEKKSGLIESVFFASENKKTLTATDFLDTVGSSIPNAFKRSLDPNFMIGVYRPNTTSTKNGLFFIFKSSSYEQAVAGAYAWEKTLLDEFSTIFGIDISGPKIVLLQKSFEDTILQNTDARVLYGTENEPLIYSVLLNNNLYMISDNKDVIIEVIKRVRTQNAKPL